MAKAVITLDEQEVIRLDQVVIDQDKEGALKLLTQIRKKIRASQNTRCGIDKLRKY